MIVSIKSTSIEHRNGLGPRRAVLNDYAAAHA